MLTSFNSDCVRFCKYQFLDPKRMKGLVYKETVVLHEQYSVFRIEIMWESTLRLSVYLFSKKKIYIYLQ